jgi:capsular polysaccharide biosynthesis protein
MQERKLVRKALALAFAVGVAVAVAIALHTQCRDPKRMVVDQE